MRRGILANCVIFAILVGFICKTIVFLAQHYRWFSTGSWGQRIGLQVTDGSRFSSGSRSSVCSPAKKLLFLKTHKTGGSTVANILYRHADVGNLTVALPTTQVYSFFWPLDFQLDYMEQNHGIIMNPDVLCSHARYNHAVMRGLFPTGAPFITVLRDPVTRYESAFFYENCPAFFGIENVPNPYQFFVERQMTDNRTEKMYTLRNGMSFDLGLNPRDFNDTRAIRGFIQETERRFDLVLIMEYFDESLALLRRLLCWTMEEMVYVRHNARLQTFRRFHIDDGLKKRVLEWNGADAMLYRHFSETLWRILDLQDEHFWSEVRTLKAASVSATTMCLSPLPSADPVIQVVSGLSLRENIPQPMVDLCKKLATKEDAYLQYFRDRQRS